MRTNQLNSGSAPTANKSNKKSLDDLSEDLSLGLILDDRDDSVLGIGWSDEEEEDLNADDYFLTPRHLLPTLDENESEENSRRVPPSRSGRWSSFSWSSLYERTTDSSLSWADDELEKETSDKVKALFQAIDHCLYQDGDSEDARPDTSDSFRSFKPSLSEELKAECQIWRDKFPHLRVSGAAILPETYQLQQVPRLRNKTYSDGGSLLSASSISSEISLMSLGAETFKNEDQDEEIIAEHGTYVDEDKSFQCMEGVTLNEKFSADPKKYFQDKLMMAIFRKVWSKISRKLDVVATMHADWILDEQMSQEGAPLSHFLSIDENAIFNGHTLSPMGNGKMIRSSIRTKSPMSDLNPSSVMPPVSLPDLRPSVASAPPVSYQGKRPGSSQNVRFAIDKRMSRRPSLKVTKANTMRPNSRLAKNRTGKSLERSPSDERKSANFQRTRSKSGSPPSRVNSSMGFRTGIQAGQPVSLPPIFNSNDGLPSLSGPTSLTSGYSSMSSRLGTASSSSSVLTPRSSNLKVETGKMTPNLPRSPSERSGISVSGTKLKKLSYDDIGRTSRLSTKTPAHWDIRTFTPSQPRPRFRN